MSDRPLSAAKTVAETAGRPPHSATRRRTPPNRTLGRLGRFYSWLVVVMKVALPAGALALLAVVAAWPTLNEPHKGKTKADMGQSEIVRPHYFGTDEKSQPYSLTAEKAEQSPEHPGLIAMSKPQSEMTDAGGAWVVLSADRGWYDRKEGMLRLLGSVHVLRDDGSEFVTDEAFSDVRKGTAWGDAKVTGQGPQGEINAEGFRLADRGKEVVFLNQSKASVSSAGGANAAAPGAKPSPPASRGAVLGPAEVAATPEELPPSSSSTLSPHPGNVAPGGAVASVPVLPPVKPPVPPVKGDRP